MIKRLTYNDMRCGQLRHHFKEQTGASMVTQLLEIKPNVFRAHCYTHDTHNAHKKFLGEFELTFTGEALTHVMGCVLTTRQLQRPDRKIRVTPQEHDALMNYIRGNATEEEKHLVVQIYMRETQ